MIFLDLTSVYIIHCDSYTVRSIVTNHLIIGRRNNSSECSCRGDHSRIVKCIGSTRDVGECTVTAVSRLPLECFVVRTPWRFNVGECISIVAFTNCLISFDLASICFVSDDLNAVRSIVTSYTVKCRRSDSSVRTYKVISRCWIVGSIGSTRDISVSV